MKHTSAWHILPFDSKLFGYPVARLERSVSDKNLGSCLEELAQQRVKLIYWFVDPQDEERTHAAKEQNGKLVDEKVTYVTHIIGEKPEPIDGLSIVTYDKEELNEQLFVLALQSGLYSRFRTDKRFTHSEYEKLYTTWVRRSIQRVVALNVLVCLDEEAHILGFVTMESKRGSGSIGLLAVDENSRGKSIGKALVQEAFVRFYRIGYRRVFVTTQKRNLVACRFYEKQGFTLHRLENVYHFWL